MTLRYVHLGDRDIEQAAERVKQAIAEITGLATQLPPWMRRAVDRPGDAPVSSASLTRITLDQVPPSVDENYYQFIEWSKSCLSGDYEKPAFISGLSQLLWCLQESSDLIQTRSRAYPVSADTH